MTVPRPAADSAGPWNKESLEMALTDFLPFHYQATWLSSPQILFLILAKPWERLSKPPSIDGKLRLQELNNVL